MKLIFSSLLVHIEDKSSSSSPDGQWADLTREKLEATIIPVPELDLCFVKPDSPIMVIISANAERLKIDLDNAHTLKNHYVVDTALVHAVRQLFEKNVFATRDCIIDISSMAASQ